MTVPAGDAGHWVDVATFVLARPGGSPVEYEVEEARAYGNRLVLKFAGIDDGDSAAGLRGMLVTAARDAAPALDENEHYRAELVGMEVVTMEGSPIGIVEDVWPTGASDLLVVRRSESGAAADDDVLIPMSREIVPDVDADLRRIRVAPPEGLLELNRSTESDSDQPESGANRRGTS